MKKVLVLISSILLFVSTVPLSTVSASEDFTQENSLILNERESDTQENGIENPLSMVEAYNKYLVETDGIFTLDPLAENLVSSNDYRIMVETIATLNSVSSGDGNTGARTKRAAPSMTVHTVTLSNQQAKGWAYTLSRAGSTTSLVASLASLGVPAAALVALGGAMATGIGSQISHKNNGKGVIIYFRLNGIQINSR